MCGENMSSEILNKPLSYMATPIIVETLNVTASMADATNLMRSRKMGSVVITDDQNKLVGIITERDILMKVVGIITDLKGKSISEIMTKNPICLQKNDSISNCIKIMHTGGLRHIPIVNDQNEPITLISIKDIVSYIMDHFPTIVS